MRNRNQHGVSETEEGCRLKLDAMGKKSGKPKNKPLALRLAQLRERRGNMSQARLAELVDMSDATVGRIEAGIQNWTQDFLQEAAKALGVHWIELLPAEPNSLLDLWSHLTEDEQSMFMTQIQAVVTKRLRAA